MLSSTKSQIGTTEIEFLGMRFSRGKYCGGITKIPREKFHHQTDPKIPWNFELY